MNISDSVQSKWNQKPDRNGTFNMILFIVVKEKRKKNANNMKITS